MPSNLRAESFGRDRDLATNFQPFYMVLKDNDPNHPQNLGNHFICLGFSVSICSHFFLLPISVKVPPVKITVFTFLAEHIYARTHRMQSRQTQSKLS
jgi:hypothetical protein